MSADRKHDLPTRLLAVQLIELSQREKTSIPLSVLAMLTVAWAAALDCEMKETAFAARVGAPPAIPQLRFHTTSVGSVSSPDREADVRGQIDPKVC